MTKEGRLEYHKHMLKLGRPSPYAEEFKEPEPKPIVTPKDLGIETAKPKKRGR